MENYPTKYGTMKKNWTYTGGEKTQSNAMQTWLLGIHKRCEKKTLVDYKKNMG